MWRFSYVRCELSVHTGSLLSVCFSLASLGLSQSNGPRVRLINGSTALTLCRVELLFFVLPCLNRSAQQVLCKTQQHSPEPFVVWLRLNGLHWLDFERGCVANRSVEYDRELDLLIWIEKSLQFYRYVFDNLSSVTHSSRSRTIGSK